MWRLPLSRLFTPPVRSLKPNGRFQQLQAEVWAERGLPESDFFRSLQMFKFSYDTEFTSKESALRQVLEMSVWNLTIILSWRQRDRLLMTSRNFWQLSTPLPPSSHFFTKDLVLPSENPWSPPPPMTVTSFMDDPEVN